MLRVIVELREWTTAFMINAEQVWNSQAEEALIIVALCQQYNSYLILWVLFMNGKTEAWEYESKYRMSVAVRSMK